MDTKQNKRGITMSNIELYCKVQNVVMGCKTEQQFNIAKQYVRLAERMLPHEWCMEVILLVNAKERELLCK